jgi:glycosyltransferase involved in cell wall biosynthesis
MNDSTTRGTVVFDGSFAGSVSVVVPVFNEAGTILALFAEIDQVLNPVARPADKTRAELIFVDDGSTDASWGVIEQVAAGSSWTKAIRFQVHAGKSAALACGFDVAGGDYIITLDADLQDDPAEIPRLLARLAGGYDLVCGWKKHRKDPPGKVIPSRVFNFVINLATGMCLHDHNCGLKGYRRATVQGLPLHGDMHRFITMVAHSRGFSICELEVNHRPRRHGRSKYGMSRFYRAFMDFFKILFFTSNGHRASSGNPKWQTPHIRAAIGLSDKVKLLGSSQ